MKKSILGTLNGMICLLMLFLVPTITEAQSVTGRALSNPKTNGKPPASGDLNIPRGYHRPDPPPATNELPKVDPPAAREPNIRPGYSRQNPPPATNELPKVNPPVTGGGPNIPGGYYRDPTPPTTNELPSVQPPVTNERPPAYESTFKGAAGTR